MPTRFIHSRSLVIPSLVTFPPVQCHQVRGLAESGGFANPSDNSSARTNDKVIATTMAADSAPIRFMGPLAKEEVPNAHAGFQWGNVVRRESSQAAEPAASLYHLLQTG